MSLVKTSLLNGVAVLTKLATSLVLNKVLAVYVGPAGYAVIGQFQNLVSMVTTFASGAVNTGVTKYTAEYSGDPQRQQAVWRAAAAMGLLGAGVFALLLVVFRAPLARWALADARLSGVMVWLAAALVLLLLNGLMLAILNGRKAVRAYVLANIVGSLITAATATALVLQFGLYGALVALAISQAVACGATAWLFQRTNQMPWQTLLGRIDRDIARRLGGFALMSATSALVVPLAQVVIRDGLANRLGWQGAGLWQALWKISETHLMLLTTTLSLYFLPRFAEIRDAAELRAEVLKGYRFVLPLVMTSALLLYLIREPLIRTLLTREFLPLADVLGWQLLGDVLKVSSWVVAYTMHSHARVRVFILTETVFAALLVTLTLAGATVDGLRGAAIAYAITYAVYCVAMLYLFAQLLRQLRTAGGKPT